MPVKKTAIVMGQSQRDRYAVIEVRWNEVFRERFVIAYRDEESLRELIAAPSIVGIGFSSREAAAAVVPRNSSRVGLRKTRGIARTALRHAVAAGVLMFYSRSVLGAAIRALVGC